MTKGRNDKQRSPESGEADDERSLPFAGSASRQFRSLSVPFSVSSALCQFRLLSFPPSGVDAGLAGAHVRSVGSDPRTPTHGGSLMHRREVVRYLGAALALPFLPRSAEAAIVLGEQLHLRLAGEEVPFRTLNAAQQALVTDIAELIIPETETPGATSVNVPQFIDLILTDWMSDDERAAFLAGLDDIGAKGFAGLSHAGKTNLLTTLDAARGDKTGAGFSFGRLKALTVYGYFTSKPVQRDLLKTRMFFDGYHGNVPFTPAT
jgi:hypothetical protein